MKKLILLIGLCVPWTAFAQTYRVYVLPGGPRIVTGTEYMNALANYNNSLVFQQYLHQQQMNQAYQQLADGIAAVAERKRLERLQKQQQVERLPWNKKQSLGKLPSGARF